jgi:RNA polymerase sigma-70 factor (ECF subfamily)
MNDKNQISLVQRIQSGDSDAEKELFEKYKDPIRWKIYRQITVDIEQQKDIASDVYLAILEGIRNTRFQPERWISLEAFIWGVTNNKIKDWLKKNKSKKEIATSNSLPTKGEEDPDEVGNEELHNILRSLLKRLPPKYKEVLDLKYFQELSVTEIGQKLKTEPRRISERINYALKLIRKECKKRKLFSIFSTLILLQLCIVVYKKFN